MKIVLDECYKQLVNERLLGHEVTYYVRSDIDEDGFISQIRDAEILALEQAFAFPFGRRIIESLSEARFIHKTGSGTDWFDIGALNEYGILAANNRGINAHGVAEHAVTLILLTLRNTLWYISSLKSGHWHSGDSPGGTHSIRGKTIGIVGLGASGSYVAQAMLAMGARVLAFQRQQHRSVELLTRIEWATFDQLLSESDVVTLHLPHSAETDRLIGRRELAMMKDGAVLINCSRGRLVDEDALLDVLMSGRLRAAGMDVFHDEPLPVESPLLKVDTVIATPHVAGTSIEISMAEKEGTLANVERFLQGKRPLRLINPEVLASSALRANDLRQQSVTKRT